MVTHFETLYTSSKVKIGYVFVLFLLAFNSVSQVNSYDRYWYFGPNNAFDWSSGSPVQITPSTINNTEGCNTTNDANGNLLFYGGDDKIYNANHTLMPNSVGLLCNATPKQGPISIQNPSSSNNYYYIYPNGGGSGLYYSSIDMTLQAGLGDVSATAKNVSLHATDVAEGIIAIRKQNACNNYWVITHNTGTSFFIDQVTSSGISNFATQSIGPVCGAYAGYMDYSPSTGKLAMLYGSFNVALFDFNATTGVLSNYVNVPLPIIPFTTEYYSLAFSPNGSKLYIGGGYGQNQLVQVDLSSGNTVTTLATSNGGNTLKLGPDGKIYGQILYTSNIGVVNNPDVAGTGCNYVPNVINTGNFTSSDVGFPSIGFGTLPSGFATATANPTSICANASATLTASGGTSYDWDTGENTPSIVVTPAVNTTYSVTVNNNGCTETATVAITVTNYTSAITGNTLICEGDNVILTASGGTSYLWNNGATTSTISVSPNTTTSYSVIAYNGVCTSSASITINVTPSPTASITGNTSICNGAFTTLTATGGGNYLWSDGSTNNFINTSPVVNSVYSVTVSVGLCSSIAATTVSVNPLPVLAITGNTLICLGNSTILTASGATSYTWSTGSTNSFINVLPSSATSYTVIGEDALGCFGGSTATVDINTPTPTTISGNTSICSGESTTLTATGSTSYTWSTGATTPTISVSPSTTTSYSVVGYDGVCTSSSSVSINVVTPAPASITGNTVVCLGNSTTLTANGGGGYLWDNGATTNTISVSPIVNSTYSVTVSVGSCTSIATITVSVNPLPVLAITGNTLVCPGNSTTLTVAGATSYTWNTGATTNSINVAPNSSTTYTVVGEDGLGCVGLSTITVNVNTPLPLVITGNTAICSGETTTLTATGATSYTWDTGATTATISVSPSSTATYTVSSYDGVCTTSATVIVNVVTASSASITGNTSICHGSSTTLTATGGGSYLWNDGSTTNTITVSPTTNSVYSVTISAGSCSSTATTTVSVNSLPILASNGNTSICVGETTTLTATGATSYTWSTGTTSSSISISPTTSTTYTVSGEDGLGCVGLSTITVNVTIPSPIIISGNTSICLGEITILTVTGATSYTWDTGATTNTISVSPTLTTTYSVSSYDGLCTTSASITVNVVTPSSASITGNTSICDGNSTTLTANGGGSYLWGDGSITNTLTVSPNTNSVYSVTVSVGSCSSIATTTVFVSSSPTVAITGNTLVCPGNATTLIATGGGSYLWSNGSTTNTITVSPSSNSIYSVTVSVGSCSSVATTTVSVSSSQTTAITGNTLICVGDVVLLTASGGTSYLWDNGATTSTISVSPSSTTSYSVIAYNGSCSSSASVSINVLPPPIAAINGNTIICSGSSTTLTASGGGDYLWSNGATTNSITVSPNTTSVYDVTVNIGSCSSITTITVVVTPSPTLAITGNTLICSGNSTTLTATGATSYTWTTGVISNSTTVSPASLTTYAVFGADGSGCLGFANITVNVNTPSSITISGNTSICTGQTTTLTANGASTYTWSTGAATNSIVVTPANTSTYSVNGLDINGCPTNTVLTVNVNATLLVAITGNTTVCLGNSTTLTANGGGNYIWSDGATTNSITVTPTINSVYSVTVSSGSCSGTGTISVNVSPTPTLSVSGNTLICSGNATTLTAIGATSYTWSTGATTSSISVSPTTSTTYSVVGSNGSGCISTGSLSITVNPLPIISVTGNTTICTGNTTTLTATGATSYTWSDGTTSSTAVLSPTINTTYTVVGTNTNGCSNIAIVSINTTTSSIATITGNTVACIGEFTILTATGGGSYLWSNGVNTATISVSPTTTTVYTVTVTNGGCSSTGTHTLTTSAIPIADAGLDQTIYLGMNATLNASGGTSYLWDNGSSSSSISVSPTETTDYCVTVFTSANCKDTDCVTVYVDQTCSEFFVPTAFSPNNDGNNDAFRVKNNCIKTISIMVYNRWGELVFSGNDAINGWDGSYKGQDLDTGVFVYKIDAVLTNGDAISRKGNVTLIR